MGKIGSKTNSPIQSPNAKRSRDPEDDVYVDNLHSHKRYLSEMMASSLNGLTVGDAMRETIMDSPARSDSMFYTRDDMCSQYSPMSEDLDDLRYCETPMSACSSQSESRPTSPVSPYRYKPVGAFCCSPPGTSLPSNGCGVVNGPSHPRQRGSSSDTEGRFPSSPSDICHSSDLRKTALLRSVQMRAQPSCSSAYDLGFPAAQEPMQNVDIETRSCSYMKPLDDEREYHLEECSSMVSSEPSFSSVHEPMHNVGNGTPSCSYMKPVEDEHEYHVEGCSSMGSDRVFDPTQEPTPNIKAEPPSCSYTGSLGDGEK